MEGKQHDISGNRNRGRDLLADLRGDDNGMVKKLFSKAAEMITVNGILTLGFVIVPGVTFGWFCSIFGLGLVGASIGGAAGLMLRSLFNGATDL